MCFSRSNCCLSGQESPVSSFQFQKGSETVHSFRGACAVSFFFRVPADTMLLNHRISQTPEIQNT